MPIYRDGISKQVIQENRLYFNKNFNPLSERQVIWVQEYLVAKGEVRFIHVGSTDRHEELIGQLASHENFKELVHEAYQAMSYNLVPDENFVWLTDNLRAQIFTLNILAIECDYNSFNKNNNKLLEEIYLFFDRKDNKDSVSNKITLLDDIHKRWHEVYKKDNYSKWLKEKNRIQIEWSQDYLKKLGKANNVVKDRESIEEIRFFILATLDLIDYPAYNKERNTYSGYVPSDRKERVIDKMKRAWSQQKYRDAGKTKKPYHLPLTKNTKSRLTKMAQVQGLSETAMLETLINRSYELDYVDDDGKGLY